MLRKAEFIVILALVGLQCALVSLGIEGVLRTASGFLFLLVLPGYTFLRALYRPTEDPWGELTYLVLAAPLSLIITTIAGLLLNTVGLGVDPLHQVLSISALTVIFAVLGLVRKQPARERSTSQLLPLAGLLIIALLVGVMAQLLAPDEQVPLASLYITDAQRQTLSYPLAARQGGSVDLVIGSRYEGEAPGSFRIGSSYGYSATLSLAPGQVFEQAISVPLEQAGLQKVSWELYEGQGTQPIRSVQIWLDVQSE